MAAKVHSLSCYYCRSWIAAKRMVFFFKCANISNFNSLSISFRFLSSTQIHSIFTCFTVNKTRVNCSCLAHIWMYAVVFFRTSLLHSFRMLKMQQTCNCVHMYSRPIDQHKIHVPYVLIFFCVHDIFHYLLFVFFFFKVYRFSFISMFTCAILLEQKLELNLCLMLMLANAIIESNTYMQLFLFVHSSDRFNAGHYR